MADWYKTVLDEWSALALATLTEVDANAMTVVVQALRVNTVSEAIKAIVGDPDRTPPPYLFVQVGVDQIPSDQITGVYYRLPCRWFYVAQKDPAGLLDPSSYCRSRLEALRVALQDSANLSSCQWTGEDGAVDSSEAVAFADQNLGLSAAELTFDTGFLTVVT